jgi:hypothetical protein
MAKEGRPTKYNPEFHPKLAYNLALRGLTDVQMAEELDIVESTFHLWKKEHPEFSESLKRGKEEPDQKVEDSLFQRATGYSHDAVKILMPAGAPEPIYAPYVEHYAPDTTAAIFWLKNRRPDRWRDKQEVEHSGGVIIQASSQDEAL